MLLSTLSTCDPGNILDSLKTAKQHRVRVSVVGLAAQVHICETLTHVRGRHWPRHTSQASCEGCCRDKFTNSPDFFCTQDDIGQAAHRETLEAHH